MNPGPDDLLHDLLGSPNESLKDSQFNGLPVGEVALMDEGSAADLADGTPGIRGGKPSPSVDVNDIVSSQGVRSATYHGVSPTNRVDTAILNDEDAGFEIVFPNPLTGIEHTVRHVQGRNSPTVINAVYNLRNFWDGRADSFFNGVSPLGFRDPDARVKVFVDSTLVKKS